eukprot:3304486-Alexandrium_andersonii.AAC.1
MDSFPALGAKDSRLSAKQDWKKSFVRTRPSQDVDEREKLPQETIKAHKRQSKATMRAKAEALRAVSYTHLTLPTICSV